MNDEFLRGSRVEEDPVVGFSQRTYSEFGIRNSEFLHLHAHSYYSFFDSTLSPEDLVELAWRQGHKALALTDTNCMTGAVVFYKAAEQAGIKPILGAEVTQPLASERKLLRDRKAVLSHLSAQEKYGVDYGLRITDYGCDGQVKGPPEGGTTNGQARSSNSLSPALCHGDRSRRAVLLARSFAGYSEICALVTRRMLEPEFDLLGEVCALSGEVIVLSDSPEVLETAWKFREGAAACDGTHTTYRTYRTYTTYKTHQPDDDGTEKLELVEGDGDKPAAHLYALLTASRRCRRRNREVYECARQSGIPLVAGCDVKLGAPDDAQMHHLLQAMRQLTTVYQLREEEKIDPAQYFQSAEEVGGFFGVQRAGCEDADELFGDLREAMANTVRIADACNCKLPLKEWKFPKLPGVKGAPEKELRTLVEAGMKKRYGDPITAEARQRMESELEVIQKLGFTEYFLLVNRIVSEAHKRGFFTVGRGSGANSILSYALGFTEVCPLKFNLYFERFLNPDRSAPPDIDIDFSWKERDELLEWCFEHFGHDRVALICTIQTLQSRQSIREVGKAFGLSETEVNAFNRLQETRFRVEETANYELRIPNSELGSASREKGKGPPEGGTTNRRVYNLAEQEPWRTVLKYAERITGFPRHLSIHCGGILITPEPVTNFMPLTRSAKGFVITQMDMFSVEDLGLIKIDLLSNRSLGVLKDALRMAERNLQVEGSRAGWGSGFSLPEDASESVQRSGELQSAPQLDHDTLKRELQQGDVVPDAKVEMFQREAMRMKLAGTRRGTSVALAGVLGSFATCVQNTVSNELVPQGAPLTVREQALSFHWVTNDPVTRLVIDQGLTMGCFYIESPGMRALFERLRCKTFDEVVTASSIIRPGVAESGMMQEYIARHQEKHPDNYEVRIANTKIVEGEALSNEGVESNAERQRSRDAKREEEPSQYSAALAEDIRAALAQIEPLSVTMQMATLQRETERAGVVGSRSGARVAVALEMGVRIPRTTLAGAASHAATPIGIAAFADERAPVTLLPPSSASERLATGIMPINAHAKSRALEEYLLPSSSPESDRPIISVHAEYKAQAKAREEDQFRVRARAGITCTGEKCETGHQQPAVEAIRGYKIEPQGRGEKRHGPNKKLRIHHIMMEMLPETYGVMVYQEDVLRVAHDLAGMSYAEADLLRRAISGKMRSRDALLAIQDHFIAGAMKRGLPREDAEEIWRQMASFAGYSFCKGHSAAFAVLSYQVAFMKAHFPAEFFAGVLTNEGGFYGAHAYLQEARRWGIEIQRPCVNASRVEYTGLTLDAEAARRAAGLENAPSETLDICAARETGRQECLPHRGASAGVAGMQGNGENDHVPFRLPRGTGRTGWIRVGLMAIQGVRQDVKERIVREREEHGAFASLDDLMERTDIGLEECRALAMAGALDVLADDDPGAEVWKPRDPRRVLQKRRALLLKAECLFRARDAGVNDGFVKLTFPVWRPNYESADGNYGLRITDYGLKGSASRDRGKSPPEGGTTSRTAALNSRDGGTANEIAAIKELSKLEADVLNFTLSAHPLDLVQVPPEVVPAREIRSHNHKRIYMAGWMIAAKLLATKTTGQAMKMLTLEDNSGTFEAVLFPRVYAKYAARTLGLGPYLVCGKVDMTLGSPTLNVEKIEVLPQRTHQ